MLATEGTNCEVEGGNYNVNGPASFDYGLMEHIKQKCKPRSYWTKSDLLSGYTNCSGR